VAVPRVSTECDPLSPSRLFLEHTKRHLSISTAEQRTEDVSLEVFTAATMKNAVFWDIETQFLPYRKHISATEHSRLILRKIEGFHGCDYEYFHTLG
jgi:hypothetical protein